MKINTVALAAILAFSSCVHAQVATDDIKVGTALTAAGITLHGISARVFPLPPGNWTVLQRIDDQVQLSGGGTADRVTLTLVNELTDQNTVAAVFSYTPDVTKVRWPNPACDAGKGFFDTAGTTSGSLDYVCIKARYFANLKPFLKSVGSSSNSWIKTNLASLVPFVDRFPASQSWLTISANHDMGRSYSLTLFARAPLAVTPDDTYEQALHTWAQATGKAAIASINGDFTAVPNTPAVNAP